MNSDTAPLTFIKPTPAVASRRLDAVGMSVSALLHVIVLLVMLIPAAESSRRAHSSAPAQAIQVSLLAEQQSQTLEETPPQPIEPPPQISTVTPQPVSVPPPKPVTKAAPKKSEAQSAAKAVSSATPDAHPNNETEELEDVLGHIRDNWLEPPGISKTFRCRLRLQYAVGGAITSVQFLKGCGTLELDDSVKRAIWKTQSLTLHSAKREGGSIDIDFTP